MMQGNILHARGGGALVCPNRVKYPPCFCSGLDAVLEYGRRIERPYPKGGDYVALWVFDANDPVHVALPEHIEKSRSVGREFALYLIGIGVAGRG